MKQNWHPTVKKFIHHVRKEASKSNTRIYFSPYNYLKDTDDIHDDGLYGYFISPSRKEPGRIVVAANLPMPTVIHTLAHEFAHFIQWKNKQYCYVMDHFVAYEKDAERKALRLLEEFNLPINMKVRKNHSKKYVSTLKDTKKKIEMANKKRK